jgi:predicted trehalose synthase
MSVKGIDVEARWFAGKGRELTAVSACGSAGGLAILDVAYADGGAERYLDVPGGFGWAALLRTLRSGDVAGDGGRLELRPGPALDALAAAGIDGERIPATDQSNTLVALGERLLVKAYRRLEAGPHPEVELLTALAGRDAPVPAFAGSVHWRPGDGGPDTAIALLQAYVPGLEDGWEAPIERGAAALRAGPPYPAAEWAPAGRAAGRLHTALAAAFGLAPGTRADLDRWHADAEAALAEAAGRDPDLAHDVPEIRARLAEFEHLAPPALTRIHGDLHAGQLLRPHPGPDPSTSAQWGPPLQTAPLASDPSMWAQCGEPLVIDFEGDPVRPLAERLRPDTPLRDLASMLRCIDHVGSAASRRAGGADPAAWIAAGRAAALDAYAACAPVPVDPSVLAVLELAKACTEYVYAQRVAPEWLYAPRNGMRRLLED